MMEVPTRNTFLEMGIFIGIVQAYLQMIKIIATIKTMQVPKVPCPTTVILK